jgi:hypothetical protein
MLKPTFWLKKLMRLICRKLGHEDQQMFQQVIKKNTLFPFCKNLLSPT